MRPSICASCRTVSLHIYHLLSPTPSVIEDLELLLREPSRLDRKHENDLQERDDDGEEDAEAALFERDKRCQAAHLKQGELLRGRERNISDVGNVL